MEQSSQINNQEDEVIETMRMNSVVKLVKAFVKETNIDPQLEGDIFATIQLSTARGLRVMPEQLIYDSNKVYEILSQIRAYIEKHKEKLNVEDHETSTTSEGNYDDDEIVKIFRANSISEQ